MALVCIWGSRDLVLAEYSEHIVLHGIKYTLYKVYEALYEKYH